VIRKRHNINERRIPYQGGLEGPPPEHPPQKDRVFMEGRNFSKERETREPEGGNLPREKEAAGFLKKEKKVHILGQ